MINPKIYVATHKRFACPDDDIYLPITAGKAMHPASDLPYIGDDTGDNISHLNTVLCEMTALYWVWKNTNDPIVGLNHYRRFFGPKSQSTNLFQIKDDRGRTIVRELVPVAASNDFVEFQDPGFDILTTNQIDLGEFSVATGYGRYHHAEDWFLAREAVNRHAPDYVGAFDFVSGMNKLSTLNMMVARRAALNDYCSWIFPIILDLSSLRFFANYDPYQKRVIGFLSERLFNVWLLKNRGRYGLGYRNTVMVETSV